MLTVKIPALRGNRLSDGAPLTVYRQDSRTFAEVRRSGISKASSLRRFVRGDGCRQTATAYSS